MKKKSFILLAYEAGYVVHQLVRQRPFIFRAFPTFYFHCCFFFCKEEAMHAGVGLFWSLRMAPIEAFFVILLMRFRGSDGTVNHHLLCNADSVNNVTVLEHFLE